MKLNAHKIFAVLKWVCQLVWSQLPLFLMLIAFSSVPAGFDGVISIKIIVKVLIPQTILLSLLGCWIASLKRWLWYTIFIIANLIFFVELGCYFCQGTRFNSGIAILMLQTNIGESKEYIGSVIIPVLKAVGCSGVIALSFWIWNHYWKLGLAHAISNYVKFKNPIYNNITICVVGLILILSIVYSPLFIVKFMLVYNNKLARTRPLRYASTIVAYYYAFEDSILNSDMRGMDKLAKTISETSVHNYANKDNLIIVYVIGESFGRSKSSLFGYMMDTNPLMSVEKDNGSLFVFDNVVSPYMQTSFVYPEMLSMHDVLSSSKFVQSPLLPSILKKGGYYVSYYDNQSVLSSSKFDFTCAYFLADHDVQQQSIDEINSNREEYDGSFISAYPPRRNRDHDFVIYHLMGQHWAYEQRYPTDFAKFTAGDYSSIGYDTQKQAEMVATFDNATLYNDYVLSKIIENLRDEVAIMIYAPDHGEEIYDYRDVAGRFISDVPEQSTRVLFEVPTMIWVSDKYKDLYPDEVEMLNKNTHKAIYNSDLPHTILDVAGIETESYCSSLSLLRDGEGRTDRRIIQNGFEYDANREKIRSFKMRYEK